MNTTASILKTLAIIVNILLSLFLALAMFNAGVGGLWLFLMSLVILTAALNISVLGLGRWLISGATGIVAVGLASVLNVCSLLGVMTGLVQYGLPEPPIAAVAVILWLLFPLLTLPALWVARVHVRSVR